MTAYTIGVKLESKEGYDRLMNNHSKEGLFGLNFKELFEGYPEENDYPCLVEYYVKDNPLGFAYSLQLRGMVDDGFLVQIKTEEVES